MWYKFRMLSNGNVELNNSTVVCKLCNTECTSASAALLSIALVSMAANDAERRSLVHNVRKCCPLHNDLVHIVRRGSL